MDLFKSDDTDQVKLEDLVGEGKKYKSVEELAKAKIHADNFIEQLKSEKAEVLKDLETRTAVEEAIRKLQSKDANGSQSSSTGNNGTQTQTSEQKATLTLEDVDKLLEEKERKKRETLNLNTVNEAVVKYAGSSEKGRDFLATKAKELGVTVDKLAEIGKESPVALLKILGVDEKKSSTSALPFEKKTSVADLPKDKRFDINAPMTKADYDELRKTNPSLYFSPRVQNKLLADRMKELKNKQS